MLPNCCHNLSGAPLMMLIWSNSHLKLKINFQMWLSRFWGVGRSQCCRFFWGAFKQNIFSQKQKKYTLYALGRSNSSYFSIFGWFLLKLSKFRVCKHFFGYDFSYACAIVPGVYTYNFLLWFNNLDLFVSRKFRRGSQEISEPFFKFPNVLIIMVYHTAKIGTFGNLKKGSEISYDPLRNFLDTKRSKLLNYSKKLYVYTPGTMAHAYEKL